jgi:hypothetical protein
MADALLPHVAWIGSLLEPPLPADVPDGSIDHQVLSTLRDGWGVVDTADLLRGLSERYGSEARCPDTVRTGAGRRRASSHERRNR